MKRLFIVFAATVLFSSSSFAGETGGDKNYYSHSVYIGYGTTPLGVTAYINRDDINNPSGVLDFGYEYRPLKMLGVGVDFGWMNNIGQHRRQVDYAGGVSMPEITSFRTDIFFISVNVRGIWVDLDHFSCYSGIRAGTAIMAENAACSGNLNFQLIPVGLEAGFKRIGAYAETGLGTNSTFSFGVRYHF